MIVAVMTGLNSLVGWLVMDFVGGGSMEGQEKRMKPPDRVRRLQEFWVLTRLGGYLLEPPCVVLAVGANGGRGHTRLEHPSRSGCVGRKYAVGAVAEAGKIAEIPMTSRRAVDVRD
jgi:hypothetical protein